MANVANERGIRTHHELLRSAPPPPQRREGARPGAVVTATNVFAHIEGVHEIVDSVLAMLTDDGVFITESHYLMALIETLQYDTIYHEHLRHYSLRASRTC